MRTFVADFLHDWKKFKNGPFPRNKVHIFDDSNQKKKTVGKKPKCRREFRYICYKSWGAEVQAAVGWAAAAHP